LEQLTQANVDELVDKLDCSLDRASSLLEIAQTVSASGQLAAEEVAEETAEEPPPPVAEAVSEVTAEEAVAEPAEVSEAVPSLEAETETVGQTTLEPDQSTQMKEDKSEDIELIANAAEPGGAEAAASVPEVSEPKAESIRPQGELEASLE